MFSSSAPSSSETDRHDPRFPTRTIRRTLVAGGITALVVALAGCTAATSETATAPAAPLFSDVTKHVVFDASAGENAENIAIDGDSLVVSLLGAARGDSPAGAPSLVRVSSTGERTVLATGTVGDTFAGVTIGPNDTIYFNVISDDAARVGIWTIASGGGAVRLAGLPPGAFPNGLTYDGDSALYAADSQLATVWKISLTDGTVTQWLEDDSLALVADAIVPIGANGMRFHNGSIWVSNISTGTLLEVPVDGEMSGTPRVVSDALDGIDDFGFLSDDSSTVFAALNVPNKLMRVCADGTTSTVLDESDGLSSPTSVAVDGNTAYITNAGLAEPFDASIVRATVDPHTVDC